VSRFRFSLASLVGVVCVAAVVLGAWRFDEKLGVRVLGILCMFALACATVAGVFGNEATRRRWLPFPIFALWYQVGGWFVWYDARPGRYVLDALMGPTDTFLLSGTAYQASEFLIMLLFGFIGMIVCHYYWKRHPPGGGGDAAKRPE